jgi:hypothetical protein
MADEPHASDYAGAGRECGKVSGQIYFANPTDRLHLREPAERLRVDPSDLSKELAHLQHEGLFRLDISGRQKYFQPNPQYPLFNEVRSIVAKTIGSSAAGTISRRDRRNQRGVFVWLVRSKPKK